MDLGDAAPPLRFAATLVPVNEAQKLLQTLREANYTPALSSTGVLVSALSLYSAKFLRGAAAGRDSDSSSDSDSDSDSDTDTDAGSRVNPRVNSCTKFRSENESDSEPESPGSGSDRESYSSSSAKSSPRSKPSPVPKVSHQVSVLLLYIANCSNRFSFAHRVWICKKIAERTQNPQLLLQQVR